MRLPQYSSVARAFSASKTGSQGLKAGPASSHLGLHLQQEWATWAGSPSHFRVGGRAADELHLQGGTATQVTCNNLELDTRHQLLVETCQSSAFV